jgi:hypothetical protein
VTPTGTVQFLDATTQIGTGTLAAGIATFATSSLNAGTHSITAKYLGDLNSGPGVSPPIVQTVTQTSTTTTLAATPNPGTAGKAVTLTATVKLSAGTGAVTGTVTFTDGATTLGTAKLAADGTASLAKILAPGSHSIVATYGGDTNDAGSSSSPLAVTVNLATTGVAITSSGSPATVLSSVTFTAVVTGNGPTPTGTVVFSIDGAAANTATLDGTGKASFSSTSLSVGTHTITAAYSGDTDDTASTSSQLTEVVKPIATATSLGTSATAGTNPQTVLIATVIGVSGPVPTGTVTFMNGTTAVGSAPLDANGVATLIPDLSNATYSIVASYSGDSIHSPSASPAVSVSGTPTGFALAVNPPTITLASSQNSTVTVTLQSNAGFADTIGFGCGTVPAGVNCHFTPNTVDLKGDGKATVQLTIDTNSPLGGGSTAMKSGSGNPGLSLAGLFLPAGLFLGWIGWRFRKRNAVFFAVLLAVCLSGALAVTGCGGFTQQSATAGTYTLQVTGVGANSNVTHSQNITLTITK